MAVPKEMYPSYPDEETLMQNRGAAGEFLEAAGAQGREVTDQGGVPLFTNVPEQNEKGTVYIPQEIMKAYNPAVFRKPTDIELSVGQEMAKVKKDIIDNVFGGISPFDIDPVQAAKDAADSYLQKNKDKWGEVTPEIYKQAQAIGVQALAAAKDQKTAGSQALTHALSMYQQDKIKKATIEQQNAMKAETERQRIETENRKKEADAKNAFPAWPNEEKELAFKTKMLTTKDPPFAYRDVESKKAFSKEYYSYLASKGLTANDVALMQADYKAGGMSLNNMKKQEAPMRAFVENIGMQVDYAKELFEGLQRTDARLLNVPLRELKTRVIGSGLERQYELFMQEISMEANKLAQGSSASIAQIPEGNRKEWLRIHDINLPLKEILPVLEGTKNMARMRMKTWSDSKDFLRKEMGLIGSEQDVNIPTPSGSRFKIIKVQ